MPPLFRLSPFLALRRAPIRITQTHTERSYATQGYGDGKGDPKAEDPQNQPASNDTKHDAEHPGPPPPDAGKGTGAGPTKASGSGSGGKTPEDASAQSGGARSKEAVETGGSVTGGEIGGGKGKGELDSGSKFGVSGKEGKGEGFDRKEAEVEKHNEEFEKRHDRAEEAAGDRVNEKFWKSGNETKR